MFGLEIEDDKYDGYVGARLIYNRHGLEILGDRTSTEGDPACVAAVKRWLDTKNKKDGPRGGKRTPWVRLRDDFPQRFSPSDNERYEEVDGLFVLRANCLASYGYVYMAAYRRIENAGGVAGV